MPLQVLQMQPSIPPHSLLYISIPPSPPHPHHEGLQALGDDPGLPTVAELQFAMDALRVSAVPQVSPQSPHQASPHSWPSPAPAPSPGPGGSSSLPPNLAALKLPLTPHQRQYIRYVVVSDGGGRRYSVGIRHVLRTVGGLELVQELEQNIGRDYKKGSSKRVCRSVLQGGSCALGTSCPSIHVTAEGWAGRREFLSANQKRMQNGLPSPEPSPIVESQGMALPTTCPFSASASSLLTFSTGSSSTAPPGKEGGGRNPSASSSSSPSALTPSACIAAASSGVAGGQAVPEGSPCPNPSHRCVDRAAIAAALSQRVAATRVGSDRRAGPAPTPAALAVDISTARAERAADLGTPADGSKPEY
eukprot:RCo036545